METALFKPLTNSFTIFVQTLDFEKSMSKMNKKNKKKSKNQYQDDPDMEYITIDYASCKRVQNTKDQFSFKKQ